MDLTPTARPGYSSSFLVWMVGFRLSGILFQMYHQLLREVKQEVSLKRQTVSD